jgi:hypothetical protein
VQNVLLFIMFVIAVFTSLETMRLPEWAFDRVVTKRWMFLTSPLAIFCGVGLLAAGNWLFVRSRVLRYSQGDDVAPTIPHRIIGAYVRRTA